MDRHRIIEEALAAPPDAIRRKMAMAIRAADPSLTVVEVHDLYSECFRFAAKGHCALRPAPDFQPDMQKRVRAGKLYSTPQTAWWEIEWQDAEFELLEVQLLEGYNRSSFVLMMGKVSAAIDSFLVALERFSSEIEGAVLVFQDGCWRYDEELYADIQTSTFENLILPAGLVDTICRDVRGWLDSRELYERHGVPWKRGMILAGPPGNGKTHLIKAMVNHFGLSALYVRGFSAEYRTDAQNISGVFERARACAPALLILEDVDTLVNAENRSHFLNELDGFARNTGILTVASANDPARLDPALVNRPSRFDRRYLFGLPEAAERSRYLRFFTSSLDPSLQLGDPEAGEIAAATKGFSYAYLKELVLSSMMAWISDGGGAPFVEVLGRQIVPLQAQMTIDPQPTPFAIGEQPTKRGRRRR